MLNALKSAGKWLANKAVSVVNAVPQEVGYWMDDLNLRGGAIEKMVDTFLPHAETFTDSLRRSGATRPTMTIVSNAPTSPHTYQYAIRCPGGVRQAQELMQRDGIGALQGIDIAHATGDHYVISVNRAARPVHETGDGEACYNTARKTIDFLTSIGAQRVKHAAPAVATAPAPQAPHADTARTAGGVTSIPFRENAAAPTMSQEQPLGPGHRGNARRNIAAVGLHLGG